MTSSRIKWLGLLFLVLALAVGLGWHAGWWTAPPSPSDAPEQVAATALRALWIRPPRDGAEIPTIMARVQQARFNVAFVETFYHGFTIYPSAVFPQRPEYVGHDPLTEFIAEGQARGIAVHPWLEVLYWRPAQQYHRPDTPILDEHPDWAELQYGETVPSRNRATMASPAIPAVREKLTALVQELTRKYDVAGLHLDYIRYQSPEGYNPQAVAAFKQEAGHAAPPWGTDSRAVWEEWTRFKERQVTRLVAELTEAFRRERLRKGQSGLVSAAIFPHYYRVWPNDGKGQDWATWIERRYVDFLTPMLYSPSFAGKERDLAEVQKKLGDLARVVPGTVIAPGTDHPDAAQQFDWLRREGGPTGFAIFQYDSLARQPELFAEIGRKVEDWPQFR